MAFGGAYLPAMGIACKYTNLQKDERVKSSQVTSILNLIEIYWSTYCRNRGV